MYSDTVTAKAIEKIEAQLQIKIDRYTPEESLALTAHLSSLHAQKKLGSNGQIDNREFARFIRNERILFQQDFFYALRYLTIERDGISGGGIGPLGETFWDSQKILLNFIAKLEEENVDNYQ